MIDAFWRFSTTLYAREGAPEACLALQDQHGYDVNLVLFALWAGFERGALTADAASAAATLSDAWARRAVRPLRALRRDLKAGVPEMPDAGAVEALRADLKALELAAERLQQRALEPLAAAVQGPGGPDAARAAFQAIGRAAGLRDDLETDLRAEIEAESAADELFERLIAAVHS
ncbi:MAG: TIGR02444 family protein [Pseudomonadota bacterium]